MAQIREIKRRIKTSKNISQVTRAMEMVSAVKMRKAQEMALTGREYTKSLENMVRVLASQTSESGESIFLSHPTEIKKILLIVVAPKKGLCGPLVGNLQRMLVSFVSNDKDYPNAEFSFVTVGKKSNDVIKVFSKEVVADFEILEKGLEINAIGPISEFAVNEFVSKKVDAVFVAYTDFISTMTQKPVIKQFLPIPQPEIIESNSKNEEYVIFEPNSKEVLESLVSKYSEVVLYQFYLESSASEHSSRMVAMKNAHDSADDIISDLSLYYNKIRQDTITTELADSVSSRLGQE